jgi:hypothetical protein
MYVAPVTVSSVCSAGLKLASSAEAIDLTPPLKRRELLGVQTGLGRHRKMMRQFVCGVLELGDAADHQLPQPA